jgi:serine-type D-Ala-D-Ala carboxypeptidase (penicillin-binding protein 5/6)
MSMKRLVVLIGLVIVLAAALYERPIPAVTASVVPAAPPLSGKPVALPWPSAGQAALGASGYGLLASRGSGRPLPIASTAKVITALAVLQEKPISAGGQGPVITLTQADVDLFNKYYLNDGSVAQVQAGEQITEYQALQALLLPSANNLADTLADWAFGSVDNYVAYANKMVKAMGLDQTTVGDATGFNDDTLSTADDMVRLGLAAVNNPVIAAIAAQPSATLPVAGTVNNINFLLGQDGVIGIKTGNTDKAGGCYLFAAKRPVSGHQVTVVGAIIGDTDLTDAIHQADSIIKASDAGFQVVMAVAKGQKLGDYMSPWNASAAAESAKKLALLVWKGQSIKISVAPDTIRAPAAAGSSAGTVTVTSGQQSAAGRLILADELSGPSWRWRIFHR